MEYCINVLLASEKTLYEKNLDWAGLVLGTDVDVDMSECSGTDCVGMEYCINVLLASEKTLCERNSN